MIAIMVHHMTKRQLVGITPADTVPDDIEMELAAMDAVGTAIGELRDADARLRILRWATERFDPHSARTPKNSLMPQAARADLDDVSVDNLDGLFESDAPVVKIGPRSMESIDEPFEIDAPVVNTAPQSGRSQPGLDSLFRDFVAEFQQLASEIQSA